MSQTQVDRDMEEILSSIRQIIAEDVEESEKSKSPKLSLATSSREAISMNEEENVLELTNMLSEDVYKGPLEKATTRQENVSQHQLNKEKLSDAMEEAFHFPSTKEGSKALISDKVVQEIAGVVEVIKQAQTDKEILSSTIENAVHDSLQPLLRSWLDENLAKIVKDVVSEQMEKVFKR